MNSIPASLNFTNFLSKNSVKSSNSLTPQEQTLHDFIDKVLDAKDYTTLDPESREILREQLVRRLNDYISAQLIAQLSDTQVEEFDKLMDTATDTQMQDYLAAHIPDMQSVVEAAMTRFINDYGVGPGSSAAN